jgi:hypothetical protein
MSGSGELRAVEQYARFPGPTCVAQGPTQRRTAQHSIAQNGTHALDADIGRKQAVDLLMAVYPHAVHTAATWQRFDVCMQSTCLNRICAG